jgi:hypothetical protein
VAHDRTTGLNGSVVRGLWSVGFCGERVPYGESGVRRCEGLNEYLQWAILEFVPFAPTAYAFATYPTDHGPRTTDHSHERVTVSEGEGYHSNQFWEMRT